MNTDCYICKVKAESVNCPPNNSALVECPRCGKYEITGEACADISNWNLRQRANLSGWIRDHQGFRITGPELPRLGSLRTPTVGEKAQRLILHLAKQNPKPGEYILNPNDDGFFGICWAQDKDEITFILHYYLIGEQKFIELTTNNFGKPCLRITPKGWSYVDSISGGQSDSMIGFIAMWFHDSIKNAQVAIENGIHNAGYKPFRVDQKEHNNDITDEIIAGIRGSKFLVADLSGHRNGVYYEAGFAKGLGLEVVWLCREGDKKDRHFDIEHLNCIFWEEDKLSELSKALENRIVATIGRGPLVGKN